MQGIFYYLFENSYIRLTASYIALQLYSALAELYSLRELQSEYNTTLCKAQNITNIPRNQRWFRGFTFCLVLRFGANLVQIILKGYDTRNVIALLYVMFKSKGIHHNQEVCNHSNYSQNSKEHHTIFYCSNKT